ncbi:MAG: proprotein convertase P-domain-containing protein, partial [Deltaproteobacteria bacterium]|nr:proprotein convertase P-domain-containing protein [Deltaproteobacteria bacterium]
EKYDLAFSGWQAPEGFWELERLTSTSDTTFDQAYYDGLGPVATWEHDEHGLGRMHDGVDNDSDEEIDFDDTDNEGLESWFGYCNGNTAASLSVPKPLHDAEVGGVTFKPYDVMALLAAVYYGDRSTMTGLRCESLHPATDEYGRYLNDPWLKPAGEEGDDAEAPATEIFTVEQGPGWIDEEHVGYLIKLTEADPPKQALIRLSLDEFNSYRKEIKSGEVSYDNRTWSAIEFSTSGTGCRDTNPATLYLTVTNLLGNFRIPFGIDADSGSHVWNYPINEAKIDEQRIITKEEANELLGVPTEEAYPFNNEARGFAFVKLTLLKSHSMGLQMVLELDGDQKVMGGEWVGSSMTRHPDFIWLPMGADHTGFNTEGTYMTFGDDQLDGRPNQSGGMDYSDAPGMTYSAVRRALAASRTAEGETFAEVDGDGAQLPSGQTIELPVSVETAGTVSSALVYMDAKADSTVGLQVELVSPTGTVVNLFDVPLDNDSWLPGRYPTGYDLGELRGVAHPMPLVDPNGQMYPGLDKVAGEAAAGTWLLRITNDGGGNANLNHWSLWLTTAAATE